MKSPSAISRFLNHATWSTRQLCRVLREHALATFHDHWRASPHQRPRVDLLVDLTSLEKSGKFSELAGWMHTYHGVRGVHLVILYVCCGALRLPWAFQIWRGKGTPSPAQLALKLLRTVPQQLLVGTRRPRLHADGGFESGAFIQGVLAQGLDIVIGVRCTRRLSDGRQVRDLMVRDNLVQPKGLSQTMCVSWVWLYRNKELEQRFVMSNLDLGGVYLARLGKRRWRIEAFFKTVKGRFGLERFAQHSKQGVVRWWCLSGLAFLLCHVEDLDLPLRPPGTWPDWGGLARIVRLSLVAEVRRKTLLLELNALNTFQYTCSPLPP